MKKYKQNVYLDIETSYEGEITITGIYPENRTFTQSIGNRITPDDLIIILNSTLHVYNYNRRRFNFPAINDKI